jgi:Ecdysteroid kinase-like family
VARPNRVLYGFPRRAQIIVRGVVEMARLAEQITRQYEREQKANRLATAAGDIPASYEAITDEWLTHLLCHRHPGARVVSHQLGEPDDGGTNRRRIFLAFNAAGAAAGLPSSVFCKAAHSLETRVILAELGFTQGEVAFYNHYRDAAGIDAPVCLLATFDPHSYNSIVVLEDLSLAGVEFCSHTTVITRERAQSQLELLARLHSRFHESAELAQSTLPRFDGYFDNLDGFINLETFCTEGFRLAEEVIPPRLFGRAADVWTATLASVAMHRTLPLTLAHNDPHVRNWYLAQDRGMLLCDWQNFGAAHWGRDVAYTIASSLTTDDRRAWEEQLLSTYLEFLREGGGPVVALDEAWTLYRRHLFSALAWWTATLAIGTTQPRDASLTVIGRIAAAIDDVDALDA